MNKIHIFLGIIFVILLSYYIKGVEGIAIIIFLAFELFILNFIRTLYCRFKYKIVFFLSILSGVILGYTAYFNPAIISADDTGFHLRIVMTIGIMTISAWIITVFSAALCFKRKPFNKN